MAFTIKTNEEENMKMTRKSWIITMSLALCVALGMGTAFAAAKFPEKPITIIVHASAGGGSDMFARTIATAIEKNKLLPVPVVAEPKPGGSGGIAFAYVAGKKKDPYYMVTATPTFLTTPIMGLTPVGLKDFTPIANLAFDELVLAVGGKSKYKTLKEVIDDAKANPKKISLAVTQIGGPDTLCMSMIEKATGTKFNNIVFNGQGEANAALLGNHVDMSIGNPGEMLELVKAGKVRILAIFSEKRMELAPEIPTAKEQGVDVVFRQNRSLVAPADIPPEARKILEETLYKVTQTEIFKKYYRDNMISEGYMAGDQFAKYLTDMRDKYATILNEMGLIKKKK
jgi:putative tricarboxylic transport membrane protein